MDDVHRVYVDSPVFSHDDEEMFRYVSTDIDCDSRQEFQLQTLINDALGRHSDVRTHQYSETDDVDDYAEVQHERQRQSELARHVDVPHLELSDSEDENDERQRAGLDLEISEGRQSHTDITAQHHSHNNQQLIINSDRYEKVELHDSLEVNDYAPHEYMRSVNVTNTHVQQKQPERYYSDPELRDMPRDYIHQHHYVVIDDDNRQSSDEAFITSHSNDSLSAKHTGHRAHNTFSRVRYQKESKSGLDFVESNRHNIKKPHRTYGQIYAQKKDKENITNLPQKMSTSNMTKGNMRGHESQILSDPKADVDNQEKVLSDMPSSVQVWQSRSKSLALKKQLAESDGRMMPVNKLSADVRVQPSVVRANISSAPNQYKIQNINVAQSDDSVLPTLRHSAPQKVSVDINLNVISPRPSLNQPSANLPSGHANNYMQHSQIPLQMHIAGSDELAMNQAYSVLQLPASQVATFGEAMQLPNYRLYPALQYPGLNSAQYTLQPGVTLARTTFQDGTMYQQASQLPGHNIQPARLGPTDYVYSPRHQVDIQPNYDDSSGKQSQQINHYKVLPPVRAVQETDQKLADNGSSGSYAQQFRQQKKHREFKTYTVDDYRKLKKEMKLSFGSLGPDMESETLKECKEKMRRQQEYAKLIKQRNQYEIHQKQKKPKENLETDTDDQINKRQVALEYAKKVPKPRVSRQRVGESPKITVDNYDAVSEELRRLQERHLSERQQVAIILHNT